MHTVVIYLKNNCPLCDEVLSMLDLLSLDYEFDLEKRNIETNDEWMRRYQLQVPVVVVDGAAVFNVNQLNYETLEKVLSETETK